MCDGAQWEILTFFGINSITFDRDVQFGRHLCKNAGHQCGFQDGYVWELGFGIWAAGDAERSSDWAFLHSFSRNITKRYRFIDTFRHRRLHLNCSVEQRSWGFFGGSIDSSEYSKTSFQPKIDIHFVIFYYFLMTHSSNQTWIQHSRC